MAHGMRQRSLRLPNMCGKAPEKLGAACGRAGRLLSWRSWGPRLLAHVATPDPEDCSA